MLQRDHPSESEFIKRHLQQRIDFEKEVLSVKEAAQKHFLSSSQLQIRRRFTIEGQSDIENNPEALKDEDQYEESDSGQSVASKQIAVMRLDLDRKRQEKRAKLKQEEEEQAEFKKFMKRKNAKKAF